MDSTITQHPTQKLPPLLALTQACFCYNFSPSVPSNKSGKPFPLRPRRITRWASVSAEVPPSFFSLWLLFLSHAHHSTTPHVSLAQRRHGLGSRIEAAAAEWAGQEQTRSWLPGHGSQCPAEQVARRTLVPSSPLPPGRLCDLIKGMKVTPAP